MKMMKKLAMLLLTVCLTVSSITMLTYAAAGKIMFTDPSTTVGETLQVKGVVEADSPIEDRTVVMTYDTSMLKFTSGDNVTETAPGQLTYEVIGQQSGSRVEYMMSFDVLKEGTTKIEVERCEAWNTSNDRINCQKGSSTIIIAAGEVATDPSTDAPVDIPDGAATVEVNGEAYTLSSEFEDSSIPDGYAVATLNYDTVDYRVVQSEKTGLCLGYLVNADGEGEFFLYVEDNATFAPYAELDISDNTSIVLLSNIEEIVLPERYTQVTITVNGMEFPAWQDTENSEFCILYAVNSNGEEALYQFDYQEGTYQKFYAPEIEEKDTSFMGKLTDLLQNHLDYVILGTGIGFILFVILIIVLSVKLYNRNAELDEIYEEFGLDFEDDEETEKVVKENQKKEETEEEHFIRIDDEMEDDIVIEDYEEDDIELSEVEDDSEIEVEFFEQEITPIAEAVEENLDEAVSEVEEDFYDDDDDLDFEIDFIDLDD